MNFGTKLVFATVLSVGNSNRDTSHIPNSQLKFKLLQNTHSRDVWVQLQIHGIA